MSEPPDSTSPDDSSTTTSAKAPSSSSSSSSSSVDSSSVSSTSTTTTTTTAITTTTTTTTTAVTTTTTTTNSQSPSNALRRDSSITGVLSYLVPKSLQDWFTPRETLEARRREEEKERDRTAFDMEWRLLNPDEQRQVVEVLELEDAYLLHGTDEAKKLAAMENNFATGFLLRYKVLTEANGKTLKQEAQSNKFAKALPEAQGIVDKAKATKVLYQADDIQQDYLLALSLYTSNTGYQILNWLLRNRKFKDPLKYTIFAADFIKGFRVLPSFWGTVYRGMTLDDEQKLKLWSEGQVVLFEGFTSCSKVEEKARDFIRSTLKDVTEEEKKKGKTPVPLDRPRVILIIKKSKSGRCLEDLSFFPKEQEVVFRPFTSFKVGKKTKKWMKNDPALEGHKNASYYYWEVEMEEAYPDTRGRKVLLWVDDEHGADSHKIMDQSEKLGVTCVHLTSTKHAKEFLKTHENLLERNISQLRIISDMFRIEDGKEVPDAGFNLVQYLVKEKNYPEKIMIFTSTRNLSEKKEKFRAAGLESQVDIQVTIAGCLRFASFELQIDSKYPASPPPPTPSASSASTESFPTTTATTASSEASTATTASSAASSSIPSSSSSSSET